MPAMPGGTGGMDFCGLRERSEGFLPKVGSEGPGRKAGHFC